MSDDYLFDKQGSDAEIEGLERLLGGYKHDEPLREPIRRSRRRPALIGGAIAMVCAAAAAIFVLRDKPRTACSGTEGMAFSVVQGTAQCGGGAVAERGVVPTGGWLETAKDSVLDVAIAKIGTVTVYGDSRVQLVGTGTNEHRLALASGHISAKVKAPPRLFVIETPTSTAVDLGCAYDLVVDSVGSHLTVTFGAVSLEGKPYGAYVPRGVTVLSRPGRGVGVPVATDAEPAMKDAVARFDNGEHSAAQVIALHATMHDIVTLWHLVSRTVGPDRAIVVGVLAKLVPIPLDYERSDMIAGNPAAIEEWRDNVMWQWQLDN
ncbi:hypothetical protein BH11MYX2_BH11MYX2_34220 [soil metagenome]